LLSRLNPFRSLPNPREVWAWGMYDFANQSFTLLIITLLFSLYFKQVIVAGPHVRELAAQQNIVQADVEAYLHGTDTEKEQLAQTTRDALDVIKKQAFAAGDRAWALTAGTSLLLVVLISPVLGAIADAKRWRKEVLMTTGVLCAGLTCAMALLGPGLTLVAAMLFIAANFCYQTGENFLASFLPDISTARTIGRISATGWAMGYAGALVLLIAVALSGKFLGMGDTRAWRPLFVFAGLWFLLGMLPAALFLRERERDVTTQGNVVIAAIKQVAATIINASHFKHLAIFLVAFFVYGLGVQTVINFASIIAADFGIEGQALFLFVLQLTVVAGATAIATGFFQDKIGAKRTILFYLAVWLASTGGLILISQLQSKPQWAFWVVGNGIGMGLGGIGTSSRSMVAIFTPRQRSAEFFGLWGLSYKLAGAIGVLSFGLVKAGLGDLNALILLAGFFGAGFVLVLFVNEKAGYRAARRAERALTPPGKVGP
jgi:MFS transporter, UMF1 family